MVQEGKKKVSAFAVVQAQQGKHKLDDATTAHLASKVQKLHADTKFNKKAEEAATKYEHNLVTNEKKKIKKRQAKKAERKEAALAAKLQAETPAPPSKPLSWHNAPKSDKRVKVQEAPGAGTKAKNKSPKIRRLNARQRRKKNSLNQTVELAVADKQEQIISTKNTPVTSNGTTSHMPPQLVKAKPSVQQLKQHNNSSKKVAMQEWQPPVSKSAETSKSKAKKKASKGGLNGTGSGTKKLDLSKPQLVSVVDEDEDMDDLECEEDDSLTDIQHEDPDKVARDLFAKLIHPHDPKTFFKKTWLKKPLHIKRKDASYYEEDDWFSTQELDRILTQERVRFGVNIDLTTFKDGKRETHNPAGRAYPAIVWDHYQQGCSVRLLNPQTYTDEVWYLLSTLQELFGCMMGANVYLTPPGTQGFAPHYDDIEGFVLQLEGRKHWKVYGPRSDADIWALTSSRNMTEAELGKPILDCVLEPGDLLYFPRGAIHQAMAQDDEHSLHITMSTHQKNSWSDLLNLMMPAALANATENDPEFRESLPNDFLNYTGIAFQDQEGPSRTAFLSKVQKLVEKLVSFAPVDGACDLMAKKFIHDSLPPYLDPTERAFSVAEQGEKWIDGQVRDVVELNPDTKVRLIRKHSLRIVNEPVEEEEKTITKTTEEVGGGEGPAPTAEELSDDNVIRVYYNTDNDRLYHGNDVQFFEVDGDLAPAIEFLQLSYPEFVSIDDLPLEDLTNKVDIAMQLYDKGLLLTEDLLESEDQVDSECSGEEEEEEDNDDDEEEDEEEDDDEEEEDDEEDDDGSIDEESD